MSQDVIHTGRWRFLHQRDGDRRRSANFWGRADLRSRRRIESDRATWGRRWRTGRKAGPRPSARYGAGGLAEHVQWLDDRPAARAFPLRHRSSAGFGRPRRSIPKAAQTD